MKLKGLVALVVLVASLVHGTPPASAARGFSWLEGPYLSIRANATVVAAHWHADWADPRCPATAHIDSFPRDSHECYGDRAILVFLFGGIEHLRGVNPGAALEDDFHGYPIATCVEEREAQLGAAQIERDPWRAYWYQTIFHRSDHHMPNPHMAPKILEEDVRASGWTLVPRCRHGRIS